MVSNLEAIIKIIIGVVLGLTASYFTINYLEKKDASSQKSKEKKNG